MTKHPTHDAAPGGGDRPFSRLCRTDQVGPGGWLQEAEASAVERARIAEALGVEAVERLAFALEVSPLAQGRIRIVGRVEGTLVQTCVVTLEPVRSSVSEAVDIELWPPEQLLAGPDEPLRELMLSPEGPEPLEDRDIDLGQLAYDVFGAAVDPYPRAPGAAFEWRDEAAVVDEPDSPFAALRRLKRE